MKNPWKVGLSEGFCLRGRFAIAQTRRETWRLGRLAWESLAAVEASGRPPGLGAEGAGPMTTLRFGRYGVSFFAAAALVAGCSGSQSGGAAATADAARLGTPAVTHLGAPGEVKGGCAYYVPVGSSSRGTEYGFLQGGTIYAASIPSETGVKYTCRYYSKISTPTYEYKLDSNESISALKKEGDWGKGDGYYTCFNRNDCFFTISRAGP